MSPVLGQGLNAGLEDIAVFVDCLQQHHGHVDTALPAYNARRLPDVQAIMTVNEVVASSDIGLSVQVRCACLSSLPCMLAVCLLVALPACPFCLPSGLPFCLLLSLPACLACLACLPLPYLLPFLLAFLLAFPLAGFLACLCSCLLA